MSEYQTKLHSVPSGGFLTDRDMAKKPILDVRELGIDFGGLTAVDGFNLMIGRNEITGLILSLIHIYVFDDRVVLNFNFTDDAKTVTREEVLGSSAVDNAPPRVPRPCLLYTSRCV